MSADFAAFTSSRGAGIGPCRSAQLPPALLFAQRCRAHIARHGRTESRRGAAPAASSQLQLKAAPAATATAANTSHSFQLRSIEPLFDMQVARIDRCLGD